MEYFNEEIVKSVEILYYKNDRQFIIRILPEDEEQEMVFAKGINPSNRFIDVIANMDKLIELVKKENKKIQTHGNIL